VPKIFERLIDGLNRLLSEPKAEEMFKQKIEQNREEVPKQYTNSIGMEFVLIPAGSFMMGSKLSAIDVVQKYPDDADVLFDRVKWYDVEHPRHNVAIGHTFYFQTTPVTQGQWKKVMGNNPSEFNIECGDDCPIETVSWDDAQDFIKKLIEIESGVNKYRLPTEAEWEYTCRAGTTTEFYFGDDASKLRYYAWYYESDGPFPVGQKKANDWGLCDMHGNILEMLEDDWHNTYEGAPTDGRAWIDEPRGTERVIRGGGCFTTAENCRSASRSHFPYGHRDFAIGFRLAMSIALGS
jgi:formylglycine-generating enzyme required for sulfatase activity